MELLNAQQVAPKKEAIQFDLLRQLPAGCHATKLAAAKVKDVRITMGALSAFF